MGTATKGQNGNGILKLDSTAFSIEGIGLACACRIRAKNTTATQKPAICMRGSISYKYHGVQIVYKSKQQLMMVHMPENPLQ